MNLNSVVDDLLPHKENYFQLGY